MNLLIAGPCAVGKSSIARLLASQTGRHYLDFDELGLVDMANSKGAISPFSTKGLDLKSALTPILEKASIEFILDIGGSTIFRRKADNHERVMQITWLKSTYSVIVVVLIASKEVIFERFVTSKNRKASEFDEMWSEWVDIEEPSWQQCRDLILDTSFKNQDEICRQVTELIVK